VTHWAAGHIGTPWVAGVSDCWSFARRVWAEQFGWDVPPVPVDATDPRAARRAFAAGHDGSGWVPVSGDAAEGDAVLMSLGRWPCHVGVIVEPPEGRAVLHSVEGAGVIATPPARLADLGFRVVGIYRRAG
jgi:cell wall-associated NlpC family hydrolase